jgi:uncharacterized membrane protein
MRTLVKFFRTCLLGGLVLLLPLLLFYLLFSELMGIVVALATPIADLFPEDTFDKLSNPVIVAILLLMGTSFILVWRCAHIDWRESDRCLNRPR